MGKSFFYFVSFVVLSISSALAAVPARAIDRAMESSIVAHREVGMTIAIIEGDSVVYERAYGLSNRERRLPATVSTSYEIGSVTKEMTAAAVMQLVEGGKIRIDAPLAQYLPNAPFANSVTIRQLLSMTSGIPEYLSGADLLTAIRTPASPSQLLARVEGKPLNFAPGTRWQHSNTNYLLLGELIGHVSGQPYQQYIVRHVLAEAPGAAFVTLADEAAIEEMAVGYANGAPSPALDNSWIGAAGNLVGTVNDMIAWDRALTSGRVVSPASYAEMTSMQTAPGAVTGYGFAFFLDRYRGQPRIWQDGSTLSFNVCDQYYPKQQTRILVFTNSNDGSSYADTLAQEVFDLLYPNLLK
jgi:CubicO group peptidase (beta-lactamase class C family)